MSSAKIVVIGSSNVDMVVLAERIPRGGETVLGSEFRMVPGGKGANQAVCAAKLGAEVHLVARVGDDVFAQVSLDSFKSAGVGTDYVLKDEGCASGIALIVVDSRAENAIVVAPGANFALGPADIERARPAIAAADAVILQLEIPMETVACAVKMARSLGVRVVLNPAPMQALPAELIECVDVLILNQHEAAELLGREGQGETLSPEHAAKSIRALGVQCVVVTLGSKGSYVADGAREEFVPSLPVKAVDTTAAGDAFTGAFTVALAEGLDAISAARFATRVAAISVTRMGAQPSMPGREELEARS